VKRLSKIKRNTANPTSAITPIPSTYTPKSHPVPTNFTRNELNFYDKEMFGHKIKNKLDD
jgi:hypothetical protein